MTSLSWCQVEIVTCSVMWALLEVLWREQGDGEESKLPLAIHNKNESNTAPSANNNPQQEDQSMMSCIKAEATLVCKLAYLQHLDQNMVHSRYSTDGY